MPHVWADPLLPFPRASLLSVHLHTWRLPPLRRPMYEPTHCFLFLVHLLFPCIPIHEGPLLLDAPCMSPHIASFSSCISSFRASPYMKAPSSPMPHVWAYTLLPFPRASPLSVHPHTWRLPPLTCPMYEPTHCFLFLVHILFPCISIHEGSLLLHAPCMSPHIASFSSCISSSLSVHPHTWRLPPLRCPMYEPTHCFLFLVQKVQK